MKLFGIYALLFSSLVLDAIYLDQPPHSIPKVTLKDQRLTKALIDYISEEELNGVPGAVILQFDKEDSDHFYIGYVVYQAGLLERPPSFYSVVDQKLILIYTGFEKYLEFTDKSFKLLLREAKGVFPPDGGVVVEPTYWTFTLTKENYHKEVIKKLPY